MIKMRFLLGTAVLGLVLAACSTASGNPVPAAPADADVSVAAALEGRGSDSRVDD